MFQLIYAWGMFQPGHILVCFNSYMCEECFAYGDNTLDNAVVSNHICVCVGNVSLHYAGGVAAVLRVFQFIYMRGMFYVMLAFGISPAMVCFNSYMCGECFRVSGVFGEVVCVSTHICVGNVSNSANVSIHICAGNVSPAGDAPVAVGVVSIHICAWNVFAIRLDVFESTFQFIYVRGMFPSASGIGRWSTRWFQLIYVRGECFNTGRGH